MIIFLFGIVCVVILFVGGVEEEVWFGFLGVGVFMVDVLIILSFWSLSENFVWEVKLDGYG